MFSCVPQEVNFPTTSDTNDSPATNQELEACETIPLSRIKKPDKRLANLNPFNRKKERNFVECDLHKSSRNPGYCDFGVCHLCSELCKEDNCVVHHQAKPIISTHLSKNAHPTMEEEEKEEVTPSKLKRISEILGIPTPKRLQDHDLLYTESFLKSNEGSTNHLPFILKLVEELINQVTVEPSLFVQEEVAKKVT